MSLFQSGRLSPVVTETTWHRHVTLVERRGIGAKFTEDVMCWSFRSYFWTKKMTWNKIRCFLFVITGWSESSYWLTVMSVVPPDELPLHGPKTLILSAQYVQYVPAAASSCTSLAAGLKYSVYKRRRGSESDGVCALVFKPRHSLRDELFTCRGLGVFSCLPAELRPLLVIRSNPSQTLTLVTLTQHMRLHGHRSFSFHKCKTCHVYILVQSWLKIFFLIQI